MSVIVILLTVNCDHKSNGQRNQNPPWKGGPTMTMRKQKARERLPNMPLPTRNQTGEHAPSFIGEMQPSVVWAQSAAYLPAAAKLNNMQKKLECKNCHCICHNTSAVAVERQRKQVRRKYKLQNCSRHVRMSSFLKDPQCVAVRTRKHCSIVARPRLNCHSPRE